MEPTDYAHLGPFSDIVDAARRGWPLFPRAAPGAATQARLREILAFGDADERPIAPQTDDAWERDGVAGEAVSWSVGYGPRTEAWLLRPAGERGRLPGALALHDHGGFKFYGKEKIADGRGETPAALLPFREIYYGGLAYANELARHGFAVLIHDTFLWGSRRFPLGAMPTQIAALADGAADEALGYNEAAGPHEHVVEKYCTVLGTSMAAVVSREDRIAANYLLGRDDVDAGRVGCIGLSGGGNRAALLLATHDQIAAAAIVGLMTTYAGLLDHNVQSHTWMLFPPGWARHGDWPDIAACRAPLPLLVQYALDDELFTREGMRAAHERLTEHYTGADGSYTGSFYPGPHAFDGTMQREAFAWLRRWLAMPRDMS